MAACGGSGSGDGGDSAGGGSKEGYVTIQPEFPKAMFVGTPVPVGNLPNLEKPGEPRTSFQAPEGVVNVAAGKPVTGSESDPIIGSLEMVTDGDLDGGDGSYVELGPGTQWVQIDLGAEHEIHNILAWHFHKTAQGYFDVIVQVSNDPEFKTAETIYNNDHDNSSGLGQGDDVVWIETNHGRIFDVNGKKARYVRLYSNGNTSNELNHYVEVQVYALPAADAGAAAADAGAGEGGSAAPAEPAAQ
jgi:hypothetical protein